MSFRLRLWLAVFVYALVVGLLIQLVLLPYAFPGLNDGAGLLRGHDWNGFHLQAVAQAERISSLGWQEFRLRPDGENIITGLCSLLYYFIAPKPWTLLPLNAAIFACAALALFTLVKYLGVRDRNALLAVVPFIVFPSSVVQFAQIHKDVFCTAGLLTILSCWVYLFRGGLTMKRLPVPLGLGLVAIVVVWLFRPYFLQILLYWGIVFFACYSCAAALRVLKVRSVSAQKQYSSLLGFYGASMFSMLVLLAVIYWCYSSYLDVRAAPLKTIISTQDAKYFSRGGVKIYEVGLLTAAVVPRSSMEAAEAAQTLEAGSETLEDLLSSAAKRRVPVIVLKENAPVENFVNKVFLKLAVARGGFTNSGKGAATNIDMGVVFFSPADLLRYVPRALQIGFFAPFPDTPFAVESKKANYLEIYIAVVEMLLCYVMLTGLIFWIARISSLGSAFWIPVLFSSSVILLMGLTVANIGTLYRMRFPFFMIFVAFGLAGLLQFFGSKRSGLALNE